MTERPFSERSPEGDRAMTGTTSGQAKSAVTPSYEEAIEGVKHLLGSAIRPEIFRLADGSFEARLTVDPDVALAALRESE